MSAPRISTPDTCDIAVLLPDLRGGGVEKVRTRLAAEFSARGYKVEFVLLRASGEWLHSLAPDVQVVDLNVGRLRDGFIPLTRYLRRREPRSLLAAMWPLTSLAVWARGLSRVSMRVVVSDHTNFIAAPAGSSMTGRLTLASTMRISYPLADGIVAVSHGVAESIAVLSGLPLARISVIHNPVAYSRAVAQGDESGEALEWASHPGPRIIAVGSLKPAKNFAELLKAVSIVRQQVNVSLLILGEGPLRGQLQAQVHDLNLGDVVFMPGFVDRPEAYLATADLFVLSSAWEGFGNSIVEALACGTPVVSTDCRSGPREILEGGRYGRLVPVGDPQALADTILASLNETHDREALIRRSQDFSLDRAADAYLKLLLPAEAS